MHRLVDDITLFHWKARGGALCPAEESDLKCKQNFADCQRAGGS